MNLLPLCEFLVTSCPINSLVSGRADHSNARLQVGKRASATSLQERLYLLSL